MTVHSNDPAHHVQPAYRKDIDGLRALAVLSVVSYHAFPDWLQGGFVGVDVFFVISGFLISSIIFAGLEQGRFSFREFYGRRIRRIFPALLLVLITCYTFGWFALLSDEYKQLGKHIAGGAGFVANFVLWKESGYFDNAAELKPLLHLWTLGVEEQFYIVWPLLLYAAWKYRFNVLSLTVVIFLASFLLNIARVHGDPIGTFYSSATRVWELLIGSIFAHMSLFRPTLFAAARQRIDASLKTIFCRTAPSQDGIALPDFQSIAGFLLIAAAIFTIDKNRAFPGWWALLPTVGALLLIAAGPAALLNRHLLSHPLMVWFGLISYPLYLWHWPIFSFLRIVESKTANPEIRIAAVLLSIFLAWLSYKFVELPIRFGKRSRVKMAILCIAMAVMGYVGYNTFQRDGLGFRSAVKGANSNVFVPLYRQKCDALTGAEYVDDWCNAGNAPGDPNVLMIGDSIANAYSPMLMAAARYSPFTFKQYARAQCPMLIGYGPAYCQEITRIVMEYVMKTPSVSTVILSADWQAYKNGRDFAWLNHKESPAAFHESLVRTLNYYESLNKKIIVLLTPPTGANPKSCVIRPVKLSSDNVCSLPLAVVKEHDSDYRVLFKQVLAAHPEIRVFDPFAYMCNQSECIMVDGQRILFIDNTHLSVFGAEFLAEKAKTDLQSLLENVGQVRNLGHEAGKENSSAMTEGKPRKHDEK